MVNNLLVLLVQLLVQVMIREALRKEMLEYFKAMKSDEKSYL